MPSLFGTDVAVNPQLRDVSRSFNGKTVRHYEVDFTVDVSGSVGPDGALYAEALMQLRKDAHLS
jgi:hypothetical protein